MMRVEGIQTRLSLKVHAYLSSSESSRQLGAMTSSRFRKASPKVLRLFFQCVFRKQSKILFFINKIPCLQPTLYLGLALPLNAMWSNVSRKCTYCRMLFPRQMLKRSLPSWYEWCAWSPRIITFVDDFKFLAIIRHLPVLKPILVKLYSDVKDNGNSEINTVYIRWRHLIK